MIFMYVRKVIVSDAVEVAKYTYNIRHKKLSKVYI